MQQLALELQSQTRSLFPRYISQHKLANIIQIVAISNEKPVPSLPVANLKWQLPQRSVAISNEKPVPSLPDLLIILRCLTEGCNLKREACSLATLRGRMLHLLAMGVAISNEKPVPSLR